MMRNNIILIGYMGCGKTTVGKNLARITGYTFTDTDEMIEKQQGRTISEIFATDGEEAFRKMETKLLEQLIQEQSTQLVISTGGGMPLREKNRKLLAELGTVIYLQTKPQTVYERIKDDTKRPLLQCEDPLARINEMLAARGPIYESTTNNIIPVDDLRQSEIAELIREQFVRS